VGGSGAVFVLLSVCSPGAAILWLLLLLILYVCVVLLGDVCHGLSCGRMFVVLSLLCCCIACCYKSCCLDLVGLHAGGCGVFVFADCFGR